MSPITMRSKITPLLGALLIASALCEPNRAQSSYRLIRNDASPQSSSIKENYVTLEKLRMRYVESGSGSAVVLIHGNAGSVEDFELGAIQKLLQIIESWPLSGQVMERVTARMEKQTWNIRRCSCIKCFRRSMLLGPC